MVFSISLEGVRFGSISIERMAGVPNMFILVVRAEYDNAVIHLDPTDPSRNFNYDGELYVLNSRGYLDLAGKETVKLNVSIGDLWITNKSFRMVSEPLTLESLYDIEQKLGKGPVDIYWSLQGLVFLKAGEYQQFKMPSIPLILYANPHTHFKISREDFIKNVLQPADMMKRIFIEIIPSKIDPSMTNRIRDPDLRELVDILLKKQHMLLELYEALKNAKTTREYAGIISQIRVSIEGLTKSSSVGKRIIDVLSRAYKNLSIVEGLEAGAAEKAIEDLIESLFSISKGIFDTASVLGAHGSTYGKPKERKNYIPKPYERDAELVLIFAIQLLSYITNVLLHYSSRI